MRQDAATQIAPQLLLDIARKVLAARLAHLGEEGLEVLAHDGVKHRPLRAARAIGGDLRRHEHAPRARFVPSGRVCSCATLRASPGVQDG
jgi:hypothetical protein